jgi:hypothetical protein
MEPAVIAGKAASSIQKYVVSFRPPSQRPVRLCWHAVSIPRGRAANPWPSGLSSPSFFTEIPGARWFPRKLTATSPGARLLGLNRAEIVYNPSAAVAGLSQYQWKLEQPAHAVANGYLCSMRPLLKGD